MMGKKTKINVHSETKCTDPATRGTMYKRDFEMCRWVGRKAEEESNEGERRVGV